MRWFKSLMIVLLSLFFAGCGEQAAPLALKRPLPFPTPAQHDLVVVTSTGPLTYFLDDKGTVVGLEHDLIEAFAQELGVGVKYEVVPPDEIEAALDAGKAHLAAAWLPMPADTREKSTPPILQTSDVLLQHEASLPLDDMGDLRGRTVVVMPGSRQLATLRELQKRMPDLQVIEYKDGDLFSLLESLGKRKFELVAIDSTLTQIAAQFIPSLQATLELSENHPVVWRLGTHPNAELLARLSAFVERAQRDGTLLKIEDRYFGHVRRLKQADIVSFLGRMETVLPRLKKHFQSAQTVSGIDWRLIAAVAYHESNWDPEATSPTGVRGIMMLTEDTADRLGIGNRLDPRESILGGARYLSLLKDMQPADIPEPDRTWLALAAYNIGPGHFNAARALAKLQGADPAAWYEMKQILPLLAQPKYYEKVKSGRARGGEAVLLVENIRAYHDILVRYEPPFQTVSTRVEKMVGMQGSGPGLRLRR
ncbi:MAG TPA: membrane-bound lytic murein transglycosylase MltF [Azonexus sp.]|nr:membrane-bound lytic murein transglycosylase MltF [Azonexus sp.]